MAVCVRNSRTLTAVFFIQRLYETKPFGHCPKGLANRLKKGKHKRMSCLDREIKIKTFFKQVGGVLLTRSYPFHIGQLRIKR